MNICTNCGHLSGSHSIPRGVVFSWPMPVLNCTDCPDGECRVQEED